MVYELVILCVGDFALCSFFVAWLGVYLVVGLALVAFDCVVVLLFVALDFCICGLLVVL